MFSIKSGVYFYKPSHYNQEENKITIKIGHSKDIKNRFKEMSTFLRKEDHPIKNLNCILHSPSNTFFGTRILESIAHNYFSLNRECKQREFFTFNKDIDMEGLLNFYKLKNIEDITVYKNLSEVPYTEISKEQKITSEMFSEKSYLPRINQLPIIEKLCKHFRENDIGCLFLPPGIGKTYISGFFIKEEQIKNVLALTPEIMICEEWWKMFSRIEYNENIFILNSHAENITKDHEKIKQIKNKIVISTYQTFQKHQELFEKEYSLIIYDESHHLATSEQYQKSLELKGKKLFLTATPKIVHKNSDTEEYEEFSCRNEDTYGKVIEEINLHDAIEKRVLCDYRLLFYREDKIIFQESKHDNDIEEDTKELEKNSEEEFDITNCNKHINMLTEIWGRKRIVVFYNRCETAKKAYETLDVDKSKKFYLDGNFSRKSRIEIFKNFQSETDDTRILFNVNTVREGVSLPCIDCILLMDTKTSSIALTQILGRGLRIYNGKTETIMCIPERCLEVWDTVRESIYNDIGKEKFRSEVLKRMIIENVEKQHILNVKENWETNLTMTEVGKNIWDFTFNFWLNYENNEGEITEGMIHKGMKGVWFSNQKQRFKGKRKGLTDHQKEKLLQLKYWRDWLETKDKIKHTWEENLNILLIHVKNGGGITKREIPSGISWLNTQKGRFKGNLRGVLPLTEIQKKKLSRLKYWRDWLATDKEAIWKETVHLWIEYEENEGKITKKTKYKNISGSWFSTQKINFKKEELKDYQKEDLLQLKYWRDWLKTLSKGSTKDIWEKHISNCFDAEKNEINIVTGTVYKGDRIGSWLDKQKQKYKKEKLKDYQKKKLLQLKFWKQWIGEESDNNELLWIEKYKYALDYEKKEGIIIERTEYIGSWFAYQKQRYTKSRKGGMTEERQKKLLELKCWRNFMSQLEK